MSKFDEVSSVHNSLVDLEIVIDRPIAQVWKKWLDFSTWVTSHQVEHLHGTVGTVGSIFRASFKKAKDIGMRPPHFHYCKVIKVVPEQQHVLKAYSGQDGSYGGQLLAFDDARFTDLNGKTKLTFRGFGEYRGELVAKDSAALKETEEDDHMLKNLQNLKQVVEGAPRATG